MADDTKSGKTDSQQKEPGTEGADKGKGLAAMLKEYEEGTQKKAATKDDDAELKSLREKVAALTEAEASRTYRKEMDDNLIPAIKGDLEVHNKHVERWLNEQAASDPRLMKLWENRVDEPDKFDEAIKALKPKFEAAAKEEGLIREKGKGDDKRLKSAVRSARSTQTGPTDFGSVNLPSMSDNEFAMHKAEVFRQAQAGLLTQ